MKKLLTSLVALILVLSGCSGSGNGSKACKIEDGGQVFEVKATSNDDLIKEIEVETIFNIPKAESYSDKDKEEIEKALILQYTKGEDIKTEFNYDGDDLKMVMTIDPKKVGENYRVPGVKSNTKLSKEKYNDFVKGMEESGECK